MTREKLPMFGDFAIWWLTPKDFEAIGQHGSSTRTLPLWLPDAVEREFVSARGRNGRGRLWVPDGVGFGALRWPEQETAISTYCAKNCAGIVIPAALVPRLEHLPGLVTDVQLRRWEAGRS